MYLYGDFNMIQKGNQILLQSFPKESFAADVHSSKFLLVTSSFLLFQTQLVNSLNYCLLTHADVSYGFNSKSNNILLT